MRQPLRFEKRSKYEAYNSSQESGTPYPLGLLDDVEIHFLHYQNEEIAALKWAERSTRLDTERLYFIMVADENTCPKTIHKFIQTADAPHVCFHNKNEIHLPGTIYLPPVNGKMGNLYSKYERFVGHFDFTAWIQQAYYSREK